MAPKGSCRGRKSKARSRKDQTLASSAAAAFPRPPALAPAPMAEMTTTTVDDLTDLVLQSILLRLTPADLLRAALACRRWCHAATRALPHVPAPPLLGYFFHPKSPAAPPPSPSSDTTHHPAVFLPLDASSSPRLLSLDLTRGAASSLSIEDVHLGLVLLLPHSRPKSLIPRILAVDPASRRRVLLPPPPRDVLPDGDRWRRDRCVIGVAVLARAHPSRLTFDAVCLTIDGDLPRAWVASVREGDCAGWRALPRAEGALVDFDPWWFEARCVHAAGNIYWHICNSSRVLQLDPRTLELSFMPVPAVLGDRFKKYRVGETPEDGRLCIASMVDDESLQIWVRGGGGDARWSDRGWFLEREICMAKVLDAVPWLPKDSLSRMLCTWLSDMDYARTGKVFIRTWGYGRYSFHLETRKLERLVMKDGKEHGDPIYAYTLAWPPEFLAAPRN